MSMIPCGDAAGEPYSIIRVRDGRALGYIEVGKPGGTPVLHFHGHGSSRLEALALANMAAALGVRLIALDRPGIGRSDAREGGRILDWPDDVTDVADQLGLERFAVEGISGGGPYALACASRIPHRLTACGLVSPLSPPELVKQAGVRWMRAAWRLGQTFPEETRACLGIVFPRSTVTVRRIERRLLRLSLCVSKADRRVLRSPEIRTWLARAFAESRRQGPQAIRDEVMMQMGAWGFGPEQIDLENIFLWHGARDHLLPVATARLLAQRLPRCRATFYPDDGHLSVLANHAQEVFTALASQRPASSVPVRRVGDRRG